MTIELSELSLHLRDFIKKAEAGERVIIQEGGRDIAELCPPVASSIKTGEKRPWEPAKAGEVVVKNAFFDPLPVYPSAPPGQTRQRGSHRYKFELTTAFDEPWPSNLFKIPHED
jgi:antitoxin (DNA-binding transcriptional repressor) of toxin-antitoxin stability system